jgi:putative pyruvate formate lyase activating enzyme
MIFKQLRPDAPVAWKNPEIIKRFSRYKGIIENTHIARYLVAKTVECNFDVNDSLENLEMLLKEKSKEFNEILKQDLETLKLREMKAYSYIELAEVIAKRYLEACKFCERRCGVNRIQGEKGVCYLTKDTYVSSAFTHWGEESVLVPSGTIFFTGCNFGCVFCQNYDISQAWKGQRKIESIAQKVNGKKLAQIAENLAKKGVLNINYVGSDPIPVTHTIISSLRFQTTNITQLWNSNFYLTEESLDLIIDFMDFWLPDLKYGNNNCAEKYSGVKNYWEVLTRNLKRIHDDGSGEIIIRHLVMPNHVECCSKPILDFIAKEVPNSVVNIMGQYHPEYKAFKFPEIARRPTAEEMYEVKFYADKLNLLYKPVS